MINILFTDLKFSGSVSVIISSDTRVTALTARDVINRPISVIYNDLGLRAASKPDKMKNRMQKHYNVVKYLYFYNMILMLYTCTMTTMRTNSSALRRFVIIIWTIKTILVEHAICRLKYVVTITPDILWFIDKKLIAYTIITYIGGTYIMYLRHVPMCIGFDFAALCCYA